jgi:hypothetical protein
MWPLLMSNIFSNNFSTTPLYTDELKKQLSEEDFEKEETITE